MRARKAAGEMARRRIREIGFEATDREPGEALDRAVQEALYGSVETDLPVSAYSRNARYIPEMLDMMAGKADMSVTISYECRGPELARTCYYAVEWNGYQGWPGARGEEWTCYGKAESLHLALCYAILNIRESE